MDFARSVEPEWLDELPSEYARAVRSRRDLRRINTLMGHTGILARALGETFRERTPARIVELGAGDGELLLRIARRFATRWDDVDVTFVDLQDLLSHETKANFAALNWEVRSVQADVFQWMRRTIAEKTDVVLANLVLHHFSEAELMQ